MRAHSTFSARLWATQPSRPKAPEANRKQVGAVPRVSCRHETWRLCPGTPGLTSPRVLDRAVASVLAVHPSCRVSVPPCEDTPPATCGAATERKQTGFLVANSALRWQ